jgi:cell division protein ZapA (FtsZ GTPase activity inhibitor)
MMSPIAFSETWVLIRQMKRSILKLRILVLLSVLTLHYIVQLKNYLELVNCNFESYLQFDSHKMIDL